MAHQPPVQQFLTVSLQDTLYATAQKILLRTATDSEKIIYLRALNTLELSLPAHPTPTNASEPVLHRTHFILHSLLQDPQQCKGVLVALCDAHQTSAEVRVAFVAYLCTVCLKHQNYVVKMVYTTIIEPLLYSSVLSRKYELRQELFRLLSIIFSKNRLHPQIMSRPFLHQLINSIRNTAITQTESPALLANSLMLLSLLVPHPDVYTFLCTESISIHCTKDTGVPFQQFTNSDIHHTFLSYNLQTKLNKMQTDQRRLQLILKDTVSRYNDINFDQQQLSQIGQQSATTATAAAGRRRTTKQTSANAPINPQEHDPNLLSLDTLIRIQTALAQFERNPPLIAIAPNTHYTPNYRECSEPMLAYLLRLLHPMNSPYIHYTALSVLNRCFSDTRTASSPQPGQERKEFDHIGVILENVDGQFDWFFYYLFMPSFDFLYQDLYTKQRQLDAIATQLSCTPRGTENPKVAHNIFQQRQRMMDGTLSDEYDDDPHYSMTQTSMTYLYHAPRPYLTISKTPATGVQTDPSTFIPQPTSIHGVVPSPTAISELQSHSILRNEKLTSSGLLYMLSSKHADVLVEACTLTFTILTRCNPRLHSSLPLRLLLSTTLNTLKEMLVQTYTKVEYVQQITTQHEACISALWLVVLTIFMTLNKDDNQMAQEILGQDYNIKTAIYECLVISLTPIIDSVIIHHYDHESLLQVSNEVPIMTAYSKIKNKYPSLLNPQDPSFGSALSPSQHQQQVIDCELELRPLLRSSVQSMINSTSFTQQALSQQNETAAPVKQAKNRKGKAANNTSTNSAATVTPFYVTDITRPACAPYAAYVGSLLYYFVTSSFADSPTMPNPHGIINCYLLQIPSLPPTPSITVRNVNHFIPTPPDPSFPRRSSNYPFQQQVGLDSTLIAIQMNTTPSAWVNQQNGPMHTSTVNPHLTGHKISTYCSSYSRLANIDCADPLSLVLIYLNDVFTYQSTIQDPTYTGSSGGGGDRGGARSGSQASGASTLFTHHNDHIPLPFSENQIRTLNATGQLTRDTGRYDYIRGPMYANRPCCYISTLSLAYDALTYLVQTSRSFTIANLIGAFVATHLPDKKFYSDRILAAIKNLVIRVQFNGSSILTASQRQLQIHAAELARRKEVYESYFAPEVIVWLMGQCTYLAMDEFITRYLPNHHSLLSKYPIINEIQACRYFPDGTARGASGAGNPGKGGPPDLENDSTFHRVNECPSCAYAMKFLAPGSHYEPLGQFALATFGDGLETSLVQPEPSFTQNIYTPFSVFMRELEGECEMMKASICKALKTDKLSQPITSAQFAEWRTQNPGVKVGEMAIPLPRTQYLFTTKIASILYYYYTKPNDLRNFDHSQALPSQDLSMLLNVSPPPPFELGIDNLIGGKLLISKDNDDDSKSSKPSSSASSSSSQNNGSVDETIFAKLTEQFIVMSSILPVLTLRAKQLHDMVSKRVGYTHDTRKSIDSHKADTNALAQTQANLATMEVSKLLLWNVAVAIREHPDYAGLIDNIVKGVGGPTSTSLLHKLSLRQPHEDPTKAKLDLLVASAQHIAAALAAAEPIVKSVAEIEKEYELTLLTASISHSRAKLIIHNQLRTLQEKLSKHHRDEAPAETFQQLVSEIHQFFNTINRDMTAMIGDGDSELASHVIITPEQFESINTNKDMQAVDQTIQFILFKALPARQQIIMDRFKQLFAAEVTKPYIDLYLTTSREYRESLYFLYHNSSTLFGSNPASVTVFQVVYSLIQLMEYCQSRVAEIKLRQDAELANLTPQNRAKSQVLDIEQITRAFLTSELYNVAMHKKLVIDLTLKTRQYLEDPSNAEVSNRVERYLKLTQWDQQQLFHVLEQITTTQRTCRMLVALFKSIAHTAHPSSQMEDWTIRQATFFENNATFNIDDANPHFSQSLETCLEVWRDQRFCSALGYYPITIANVAHTQQSIKRQ